ncbi:hypothetical protein [Streptomyces sp. NPDC017993]|uniref:hypothetical protein n=1 Tax=Streptomyces sp. NPDC017993 TaxID=3365027 RepID=UPI0037B2D859
MTFRRRLADLWQPWQPGHALLAIPLGLIVVNSVVDVLAPGDIHLGPLLIVAPAITPGLAGPRMAGLVGALAVAAQAIIGVLRDRDELFSTNHQAHPTTPTEQPHDVRPRHLGDARHDLTGA